VEERDRTCIGVRHLGVSGSVGSTHIKPAKSETPTGAGVVSWNDRSYAEGANLKELGAEREKRHRESGFGDSWCQ
jgi:hypothetical protein